MSDHYRAAALTSHNHVTEYFRVAKEHGVQWQLNGNYCLTCTPGRVAARSNRHGNCATATVHTVVLCKFRAACVSKIIVEIFLPRNLMKETEGVSVVLRPVTSNAAALYYYIGFP